MFAMRSACAPACTSFVAPGATLREVSSRARRGALAPRRALTPDKEDLYFTLGVSPGASQEAVKRAYKRLAKQFHPDVCDAPDAEAKFNAVRSAYETLVAERGNLDNVGTEEWRAKWSAQLRQMRDVEQGRAKVNVRRRRVVRARGVETDETRAEVDDQPVTAASPETRRAAEELERALDDGDDASEDEATWQREQEMRWAVNAQLSNLKDRTRRRRRVAPPQRERSWSPSRTCARPATAASGTTPCSRKSRREPLARDGGVRAGVRSEGWSIAIAVVSFVCLVISSELPHRATRAGEAHDMYANLARANTCAAFFTPARWNPSDISLPPPRRRLGDLPDVDDVVEEDSPSG